MTDSTPNVTRRKSPGIIVLCGLLALAAIYFFAFLPRFGPIGGNSTTAWLNSTWTPETNYEHGPLVIALMGWLFWRARPAFVATEFRPAAGGLVIVALGVLLFLAGFRTSQPRLCVVALPCLTYGAFVYTHGWARSWHLIFPLSMVAFVIYMPGMLQATTGLQIIATKMAHYASNFLGMEMGISGNRVFDPTGRLGDWEIDEGCSGIRSIVALTLVTYVYGMIVHKKWSERLVIFAACIPIAILANGVRVTSILIMARVNVQFAKTTWHDYSGFMSFGAALALLMILSTVMRHGLRALMPKVKVTQVSRPAPAVSRVAGGSDPY